MAIRNNDGLRAFFQNIRSVHIDSIANIPMEIESRIRRLADFDGDEQMTNCILESIALQVHDVFTALEKVMEGIADEFDGHVPGGKDSHKMLINQMSKPSNGRPSAVISKETQNTLDLVRAFRHFVRHDYASIIVKDRVIENSLLAKSVITSFSQDLKAFEAHCLAGNDGDGTGGGAAGGPRHNMRP